jgi:phospholipid/cholesterol/gamma-HCH transport system substrate-binding protein
MKFRIKFAEQIVGLFIILALVGLATILILMGINQRWFAQNYLFTTKLRNAVGLSQGMPIKFKGFDIGKVTDFSFNSEEDMVDVTVEIFDTYYEQVRKNSLIELSTGTLGFGGGLSFYPGPKGERILEEGTYIPSTDTQEGRALIRDGLASLPTRDDPLSGIIDSVDKTLRLLNEALEGGGTTEIATLLREIRETVGAVNGIMAEAERQFPGILQDVAAATDSFSDPTGLIPRLLESDGSVSSFFNDQGSLFDEIEGILKNLNEFSGFVNGTSPQISGILEQGKEALDQGKDVLEGLRNNPLLSGGITEVKEQATTFDSFRDEDF